MAATTFTELFDYIRVATGNDDPVVGAEVLPNERIIVLLKTAVLTLPSYSDSFPTLVMDLAANPQTVFAQGAPTDALTNPLLIALVSTTAHKYWVGIGNKLGATEALSAIYKAAELISGHTLVSVNETDLLAAMVYKKRKQLEATAQMNLR
jgi:hypothetical protein